MGGIARASASVRSLPLLQRRDVRRVALVRVTGDRGLAGAFNAQVLRRAIALYRQLQGEGVDVRWLPVGRKGTSTLRFSRFDLDSQWGGFSDNPSYGDAQAIAHRLTELYTQEEVDRVVVIYNAFVSALTQRVTVTDVLPISEEMLETDEEEREQILERLLPVYLETELYRALLESAASEQGARMTAMRNATKSAGELIDSLTLAKNRARQAEITQEILEVVAGADALTQS